MMTTLPLIDDEYWYQDRLDAETYSMFLAYGDDVLLDKEADGYTC